MENFRYIGITDECVTCEQCGKPNLKSTVVLATLDRDGNIEDFVHYGSSCAARVLGQPGTGRRVLDIARGAHRRLAAEADDARRMLAHYGLNGPQPFQRTTIMQAAVQYAEAHSRATWAADLSGVDWQARVWDMVERKTAILRAAAQVGL